MADLPIIPFRPVDPNKAAYENLQPDFGILDSASAAFQLASQGTATNSLMRIMDLKSKKQGDSPVLGAEELNQRFPDMLEPFRESMPLEAAQEIAERKRERERLSYIMARGPRGAGQFALNFAASLVPHALDPIELGAGLLTSGGLSILGKALVNGKRFANVGRALTTPGFASNAVSGAIGNLATEPLSVAAASQEMDDYTVQDAFIGAVGGAIGFAGLGYIGGKIKRYLFNMAQVSGTTNHADVLAKAATENLNAGKKFDATPIIEDLKADVRQSTYPYQYERIDSSNLSTKKFYIPTAAAHPDFYEYPGYKIDSDLGKGTYITDNPNVAHGLAGNRAQGFNGAVIETNLKDLNLIDLDAPIVPSLDPIKGIYGTLVETLTGNKALSNKIKKATSFREVTNAIEDAFDSGKLVFKRTGGETRFNIPVIDKDGNPVKGKDGKVKIKEVRVGETALKESKLEDFMDLFNNELKELGFDGYRGEGFNSQTIMIFDGKDAYAKDKIKPSDLVRAFNEYRPDPKKIKEIADKYQSKENLANFDPIEEVEWKTYAEEITPIKAEDDLQEVLEQIAELKKQNAFTVEEAKFFDFVADEIRKGKTEDQVVKALEFCLREP